MLWNLFKTRKQLSLECFIKAWTLFVTRSRLLYFFFTTFDVSRKKEEKKSQMLFPLAGNDLLMSLNLFLYFSCEKWIIKSASLKVKATSPWARSRKPSLGASIN